MTYIEQFLLLLRFNLNNDNKISKPEFKKVFGEIYQTLAWEVFALNAMLFKGKQKQNWIKLEM